MNRRSFLAGVAALPIIGRFAPAAWAGAEPRTVHRMLMQPPKEWPSDPMAVVPCEIVGVRWTTYWPDGSVSVRDELDQAT
jgi:hypothetical protein